MVLAVFLDPLGNFLEDELLGAGNADVGSGIGSGFEGEFESEILAGCFHDCAAATERLIAHMACEGNVDESLGAELFRCPDDSISAGHEVVGEGQIGRALDDEGVFVRLAGEKENVLVLRADALEGLSGSGDGLVDDDRLHEGIIGEGHDGRNEGLLLGHEIIGIGDVLDHAAGFHGAIFLDKRFRAAEIVLGLGNCSRHDADMEFSLGLSENVRSSEDEGQRQQNDGELRKLFHRTSLINGANYNGSIIVHAPKI